MGFFIKIAVLEKEKLSAVDSILISANPFISQKKTKKSLFSMLPCYDEEPSAGNTYKYLI